MSVIPFQEIAKDTDDMIHKPRALVSNSGMLSKLFVYYLDLGFFEALGILKLLRNMNNFLVSKERV